MINTDLLTAFEKHLDDTEVWHVEACYRNIKGQTIKMKLRIGETALKHLKTNAKSVKKLKRVK